MVLSILVHLLFGAALGAVLARRPPITFGDGPLVAPMVLTLKQAAKPKPEAERVIQMVESPVEAEAPPDITDLISDVNSRAADETPTVGQAPGPTPEVIDDLATLAARPMPHESPAPPAPPAAQPQIEASFEPLAPTKPLEPPVVEKPVSKTSRRKTVPAVREPVASEGTPKPAKEEVPADSAKQPGTSTQPAEARSGEDLEPFRVAKADTRPLAPEGLQDKTRGKVGDAKLGEGFTSFDAIRDQIAPYLKLIKTHVERRWNEEIITRYNGHMPTEATVDCSISAAGKVISVQVVGAPKDRLFAALCKRAIERAGPFGPFPFEVPEMYRSKNLEIRWTFSFLR